MRIPLLLAGIAALCGVAQAQSSSSAATPQPQPSAVSGSQSAQTSTTPFPTSLSLTTGSRTIITSTRLNGALTQFQTVVPTIFNVTLTLTPTSTSASSSASAVTSPSTSPSPAPIVLDTRVDPAFGVLGAILILTGLPSAFWGHKNRWTSFFLTGFYTLSLVCAVLILRYGVVPAVNPPTKTLRGMFVLASAVAGIAGGGIAIFFWKGARYGIGAWGGLAVGLWIQSFNDGGVIKPIGFRWILYIGLAVVGFTMSTVPKLHYHVLLISTAIVGSSALILGVDCYTTAGLKEFYMWNLGFEDLFPKFTTNGIQFPVSQTMQIELGLIAAIALMGIAVQLRIMKVLKRKLREIAEEARKRDEEAELQAANRFADIKQEKEAWENDHGPLGKPGRVESTMSSTPLMKDVDGSSSPTTLAEEGRQRHSSNLSDFKVAPTSEEELRRSRYLQNPGALPALDLGLGIKDDVSLTFIAKEKKEPKLTELSLKELQDLKKKQELVAEIQNIRKSIEVLKSEPAVHPTSPDQYRRFSLSSRRTSSMDASTSLFPPAVAHARPPRATDPRARVRSMDLSSYAVPNNPPLGAIGESISRPNSAPLKDPDWDTYIQERKLLQPPSGVTPPIQPTPAPRAALSTAVQDALEKRKRRESVLVASSGSGTAAGSSAGDDPDDVPLAKIASGSKEKRLTGLGGVTGFGNMGYATTSNVVKDPAPAVTILPPRKSHQPGNVIAPTPQRAGGGAKAPVVKTFEELNERHREKMRNLQEPVTKAEKESADVRNARERWEKAKKAEKDVMARKQADKAAVMEKKHHSRDHSGGQPSKREREGAGGAAGEKGKHRRSVSADRLGIAGAGSASKRLSVLKVEDWQRYQATATSSGEQESSSSGEMGTRRRDSVPFPGHGPSMGHSGSRQNRDPSQGQGRKDKKSRDYLM